MTKEMKIYIVWAEDEAEYMTFQAAFTDEALADAFAAKLPNSDWSVEEQWVNSPSMIKFAKSPLRRYLFHRNSTGEWVERGFDVLQEAYEIGAGPDVSDWDADGYGTYVAVSAENADIGLELAKAIFMAQREAGDA